MRLYVVFAAVFCISSVSAEVPSVEILGIKVVPGMTEKEIRTAFPSVYCADKGPAVDPSLDFCSISDGIPPGADGEVTFKNGLVIRASRNWFLPSDFSPYDALLLQHQLLTKLAGEDTGVCAKIETFDSKYSKTAQFAFPKKVLTVRFHNLRGEAVFFTESLRINPVPASHKVRGKKMQGKEWCAYIN